MLQLINLLENDNSKHRLISLGILFVFRTGLRAGELIALKESDIKTSQLPENIINIVIEILVITQSKLMQQ